MPVEETNVVEMMEERSRAKSALEEDVRLKVFAIGVGNAGNQTIAYGHREGLNVFAVNTSIRDLSDAIMDTNIPSFVIGNEARGSGKNIERGKQLFKENGRSLFQLPEFIEACQESDVIVVVSATGGGTGPSVSPEICRILKTMFPKKIIIYHGITPKDTDSNVAFSNTTYCMDQIKSLDIPYMLTDLGRFENDPNDVAFVKADKHVIDCIKAISGNYLKMSNSQMIDENDLKSIISEPGYMGVYIVSGITSAKLERKSMQQLMTDQMSHSPSVMMQKDGISMQMGSILTCPEDLQDTARTGDYKEIFDFIGHKPKNGIYENTGVTEGTDGQFVIILSGMTYPINRLGWYTSEVKKDADFVNKRKEINTANDAALVQQLVSNSSDKLYSDTKASQAEMNSVLDDFFG